MLARLLALFLITPVIELALLVQLDGLIGFWPTMGLIVVTGMTGTFLARREGLSAWRRLNQQIERGGMPGKELVDGVIILIAGALLITPGVLTDVAGLVGLLPFTRTPIRRAVMKRVRRALERGAMRMQYGGYGGSGAEEEGQDTGSWQGRPADRPSSAAGDDATGN